MPARGANERYLERAGTEACPYEWLSGINSAIELEIRYHGQTQRPARTKRHFHNGNEQRSLTVSAHPK